MKLTTFSFIDRADYHQCYTGFLELRKRVLVDGLGWDLPVTGETESDQYDNPTAVYSAVEYKGRVIAGARAAPCSARWGGWSYMLNDADQGLIPGIPRGILSSYPTENSVWECTRFVSDDVLGTSEDRLRATRMVVAGLCQLSGGLGASSLMSLSPAPLGRLLRSFGYKVSIVGAAYVCADDGRRYRPFTMDCDVKVNSDLIADHSAQRRGGIASRQRVSLVT